MRASRSKRLLAAPRLTGVNTTRVGRFEGFLELDALEHFKNVTWRLIVGHELAIRVGCLRSLDRPVQESYLPVPPVWRRSRMVRVNRSNLAQRQIRPFVSTMTAAPETESRGGRWRAPISAPREGAGRGYGRASRVNPRTRRGQPDLHRGSGLRSRLCAVFALRRSVYHRRREFVNYNNVKASDTCPDAPPAADLIPARHPSRRAGAGRPVPTGQTSHAAGPAPGPGRERNGSFGASWSGKLPFPPPEPFDRYRPDLTTRPLVG